jgi:hypothetical protein
VLSSQQGKEHILPIGVLGFLAQCRDAFALLGYRALDVEQTFLGMCVDEVQTMSSKLFSGRVDEVQKL